MTATTPPVISLSSPTAVSEIASACSTWGGFVLVHHGLDSALLDQVLTLGHQFFDLPLEIKEKYNLQLHGAKWRGYMPYGGERSCGGQQEDAKEGLYLGDEHPSDHPQLGLPTFGSNVFPNEEIPAMKDVYVEYHKQMKELGNRMMRVLATGLELPEDTIEQNVTQYDPVILPRAFSYKPQQAEQEGQQWGIGEHSDYGLWTMILTNAPGLEFQHPESKQWCAVPFVPHGIIMNVGDVLDRLTGGKFISPFHRARNLSSTEQRLSLPFFYDPSWTAKMTALPLPDTQNDTQQRVQERWAKTKIRCQFDGSVEYSEFLAKKVANVFPDLIPEAHWKHLQSTSEPSTRHVLVVETPDASIAGKVRERVIQFYHDHQGHIKESHGMKHIRRVYEHATKAVHAHVPPLSSQQSMLVLVAALLHDVDDTKYFPSHTNYEHARQIMSHVEGLQEQQQQDAVVELISYVSCSQNKNRVPPAVAANNAYWKLIPRYADRLEAVGRIGVVRCYQYNCEKGQLLSSENTPCPQTEEDVWKLATPRRFEAYNGDSDDMISHYYDKLLHVARPPPNVVRNSYLEKRALASSKELVEVCLRYGRTGVVDEAYIRSLAY
ncbi:Probable iron/ascorbate oxidoreductase DDB_G0283291 [Seminavis robusta]|uniref:Probable iron/ascorbate oxidoreductase DDB_G0283291 n=1 Tax=Seminavis robusta TaxID=568900 RepID=A0A9N8E377_9STRA|nr:Probable iron/ascorbate oxidoreductase DDB_G0283291 [Seminavis robusta]|eukprot:Sro603_g173950.1 Probable iron/ascorbate oxidoreductase DDB_G0283291 (605) ;mRNA; r:26370-28184